jgi:hypothetical protein
MRNVTASPPPKIDTHRGWESTAVAQLTHLSALCADSFHRKAYANFSVMDISVAPPSRASEVEAA